MKKKKKLKKKVKLSLLLILIIIALLIIIIYKPKNSKIIYKDSIIVNIGDNIPGIKDYVSKKYQNDVKDIKFNIKTKDNKVYNAGTFNGTIILKDKSFKVKLIVKDSEKPKLTGNKAVIYYIGDDEKAIYDNLNITDNSQDKLNITLNGDYDLTKEGKYNIKVVATDKGNNSEKFSLILYVVKKDNNTAYSLSKKDFLIKTTNGITTIDDIIIVNKTYGIPKDFEPKNLVKIKKTQRSNATVVDYVNEAFEQLVKASEEKNLNIISSTAYRSYSFQSALYNKYVSLDGKEKADTYSARPGHSEHHTGLAIDLNDVSSAFDNTPESKWLSENAYKFGFILRYQKGKEDITGYNYESWHIRYVGKDLAEKLYLGDGNYLTLEEYFGIDSKYQD